MNFYDEDGKVYCRRVMRVTDEGKRYEVRGALICDCHSIVDAGHIVDALNQRFSEVVEYEPTINRLTQEEISSNYKERQKLVSDILEEISNVKQQRVLSDNPSKSHAGL